MPTVIENIYDQLVTAIDGLLTDYTRLPNPYQIEANTYLHLRQGYGIAIGPAVDTEREIGCKMYWERNFGIVLVRKLGATQNNTAARVLIEKDILNDHDTIVKYFYNNQTLGGYTAKIRVDGDSGISFIDASDLKFLTMEVSIFVEYSDTI